MTMSSEEGADRVAARGRTRPADDAPTRYNCESCGAVEFVVRRHYDLIHTWEESIPCQCGEGDASTRSVRRVEHHVDKAELGDDHRPGGLVDRDWEADDPERDDPEYGCPECLRKAADDELAWDVGEIETETGDEEEVYVCCAECDHEIEFGWSHPDRGGRIWPVEASDFNPWVSFPEERYRANWARRGWLRPAK